MGAVLFLIVQSILLVGWTSVYLKQRQLKNSKIIDQCPPAAIGAQEAYRDFDPYFVTKSSPEVSLDLVQRKLIMSHLEGKKHKHSM